MEVIEAFRTREVLQPYLDGGVRKVVVAAPVKEMLNIVMGCNDHLYDPEGHGGYGGLLQPIALRQS